MDMGIIISQLEKQLYWYWVFQGGCPNKVRIAFCTVTYCCTLTSVGTFIFQNYQFVAVCKGFQVSFAVSKHKQ